MLRVHSRDLHEHIALEAGECLESGLYTDLAIRCEGGHMLHAHRLVMSAVSPYLNQMLDVSTEEDSTILDLPDAPKDVVQSLLDIVYSGSIEATLEEMRNMLTLAHSLYISVPVSDQLINMIGLKLPLQPALQLKQKEGLVDFTNGMNNMTPAAMSMLQQQIFGQYAMMNGLLGEPPNKRMKTVPNANQQTEQALTCPVCNVTLPTIIDMRQHMASHEQNKEVMNHHLNQVILASFRPETGSYVCSVCQSSYTNKGNFKQHVEKHFKNGEFQPNGPEVMNGKANGFDSSSNLYKCHICQSTYSHPGNFKQHLLKHEREKRGISGSEGNHLNSVLQSAFADRVDNGDPCKTYICHECNRTFKHPGNFKQHMASHNKQIVSAPNFPVENLLRRPMPGLVKMVNGNGAIETKPEDHDWDCPECSEKFSKGLELQTHMKMIHNIEMVLQPEEMRGHSTNEIDWECDMCSQVFKTEGWLQRHKAKIHGVNIPGGLDPLMFANGDHDTERAVSPPMLNTEEGLKALALAAGVDRIAQFHCDAPGCFQSFTTEGWLLRHRSRQHAELPSQNSGPRIYPCSQCGKEFGKMSKLTQHMKTHSPEAHYKHPCDICGKKFTRPQHVIRHKLLHTGEKPHACPNCDKSFAREDKLKHHLLKGCSATGHDLDQSMDSRDSESVTGEPSKDSINIDDQKNDDDLEIDDDEDGAEDAAIESNVVRV